MGQPIFNIGNSQFQRFDLKELIDVKRVLSLLLTIVIVSMMLFTMSSCAKQEAIAIVNGDVVYMSDIEDDITLMMEMEGVDKNDTEKYNALVYEVLNSYVMDYICAKEMEALGLKYKSEYYGASYESLVEAYGSESKLIKFMKSIGLDREYIEDLCRKQARKATLVEYFASTFKLTEEELLAYYIENTKDFTFKDVRDMSSLYFAKQEEALAAIEKIKEIGFDEYYNLQETDEKTTLYHIKFEHVAKDDFPENMATILWALEIGAYSEPLPCSVGYTIIRIDGETAEYTYPFEAMKDSIEEVLIDDKTDEYLEKYFEELQEKYKVEVLWEGTK